MTTIPTEDLTTDVYRSIIPTGNKQLNEFVLSKLAEQEFAKLVRDLCHRHKCTDADNWAMSGCTLDGTYYLSLRIGRKVVRQASDDISDALLKIVNSARGKLLLGQEQVNAS